MASCYRCLHTSRLCSFRPKIGDSKGEYGGWFVPVMAHTMIHLEELERPIPLNLEIPPYDFIAEDIIKIG